MRVIVYSVLLCLLVVSTNPQAAGILIPKQTLAKIKSQAAQDHPDDYAVQEYVIKTQTQAYYEVKNYKSKKVPKKVLNKIKKKAAQDFPNDYSVQIYIIKQQVQSYLNIN